MLTHGKKVKMLQSVPRRHIEERRYSCTDSYPQHYVQVSGQLHPWGKTPDAPSVGGLVGPKASVDNAAVLGIEP